MKKIFINLFKFILFTFLMVSVLSSCAGNVDSSDNSDNNSENSSNTLLIGKDGGTVSVENKISITIPENALSEDTEITASYNSDISKIDKSCIPMNFLSMAEFGPSGTNFNIPCEVSLELGTTLNNSEVSIYYFDEEENCWSYCCKGTVEGTKAKFEVNHFSKYVALNVTPQMMDYFDTLVRVLAPDDTAIVETFKDFLVNNCKVMEYITRYGKFYYRPYRLIIIGDYCIKNNGSVVENKNTLTKTFGGEYDNTKTLYSLTGSSTVNYNEYKKIVNGIKTESDERSYVSRCNVQIQYEMIEPEISISPLNTEIKPGESTEVIISLVAPDFDLELDNYPIYVKSNDTSILTVSQSNMNTDKDGKAKVTVTRKANGDGSIDVVFAQADVDGNTIALRETYTFEDSNDEWKFNTKIGYKNIVFAEQAPNYYMPFNEVIESDCPEHEFEYEYNVNGNFSVLPLPESLKNSEYAKSINGIVCGKAKFTADKNKTKYSFPASKEHYQTELYKGNVVYGKYNDSWDVTMNYKDIDADVVGLLFVDGTIQFSISEFNKAEDCYNVKSIDDLIDIAMGNAFDNKIINKYENTTNGVVSAKIVQHKTIDESPEGASGNTNGTHDYEYYFNVIPNIVIKTKLETGTKSLEVNSDFAQDNYIETLDDCFMVEGWNYCIASDLSMESYTGSMTFSKGK